MPYPKGEGIRSWVKTCITQGHGMSINKSIQYLGTDLKAFGRRLGNDLASELVVALSVAVILALFFYMFRDFLNVKLRDLSPTLAQRGSQIFAVILLIGVTAVLAGAEAKRQHDVQSLSAMLRRLGESESILSRYEWLSRSLRLIAVYGLAWFVLQRWFVVWRMEIAVLVQLAMLAVLGVLGYLDHGLPPRAHSIPKPLFSEREHLAGEAHALMVWRLRQIIRRNRPARMALVAAGLVAMAVMLTGWQGLPVVAAIVPAMFCSLFVSMPLFFQLAEDLKSSWIEQGLGISHGAISRAYSSIGLRFAVGGGFLAGVAFLSGLMLGGSRPTIDCLRIVAVGAMCPLTAPSMLFQIDPRRPTIQILIVFLASLFLATAIAASWWGILAIPGAIYASQHYQANRFYRA